MEKGKTYWFTGLSCSGKSTLAKNICIIFSKKDYPFEWLDGDFVRGIEGGRNAGLCGDLGFSPKDRKENLRRIAEVSRLFNHYGDLYSAKGIDVLASFISPTNEYRKMVREIIGPENFKLIYVKAPLKICEKRDSKGLYKKARAGEIKGFTGIDAPFEEPLNPDLILDTKKYSLDECLDKFYDFYNSLNSNISRNN